MFVKCNDNQITDILNSIIKYLINKVRLRKSVPYIVSILLAVLSLYVFSYMTKSQKERSRSFFEAEADNITRQISERLYNYMVVINGGIGIFAASDYVDRYEWSIYYQYQQKSLMLTGVQNLLFIKRVEERQKKDFLNNLSRDGFTTADIFPAGKREIYAPVKYAEPVEETGKRVLGMDMFTDNKVMPVLIKARDMGRVFMSPVIDIYGGDTLHQGLLIVAAVYKKGVIPQSVKAREETHEGFVAITVVIDRMMESLFPEQSRILTFSITESSDHLNATSIFSSIRDDSAKPGGGGKEPFFQTNRSLNIFDRTWSFNFESVSGFEESSVHWIRWLVLTMGFIISILSLLWLFSLNMTYENAKEIADKLTLSLKESEASLRQITDNITDVVFTMDLNLNTTYISPSVEKLLGIPANVYIKMGIESKHPLEDLVIFKRLLEEEMKNDKNPEVPRDRTKIIEARHYKMDGSLLDLSFHISFIRDSGGEICGILGVSRDVTERNRVLRDLIKAKERAEQSDKLKLAFINNISHEIRTPLNSILGFGQFLADNNLSKEEREQFYGQLKNSSTRLMQSITDFIDISMVSSGTLSANFQHFDLIPLLDEVIQIAASQNTTGSALEIVFESRETDQHLTIYSDRELLRKSILHLLSNSIKFTKKGIISLGYYINGDKVIITVKDTGIGISPEKIVSVFKPYIQENSDMTRGHEGSGLGLAITKGIVTLLGGEIWAESAKMKGSSFYISVPIK